MLKNKIFILFLTFILLISFSSCKNSGDKTKEDWQDGVKGLNDDSSESENKDYDEISTILTVNPNNKDKIKIDFDAEKAEYIGSFDSDIYGTLNVFLQDGYFLIYDEESKRRFTVFAENYSTSMAGGKIELIGEDMNFDGHTDFRILFQKDSFNSYYYCFLWNMSAKTFDYSLPLTRLASPQFDINNKVVTSEEKLGNGETTKTVYTWNQNNLSEFSNESIPAETNAGAPSSKAPYDIIPEYTYDDGTKISTITLNTNSDHTYTWLCYIENEDVVYVTEKNFDKDNSTQTISFTAAGTGQTTITLRYAASWNDNYSCQLVFNVYVDGNGNIKLKIA